MPDTGGLNELIHARAFAIGLAYGGVAFFVAMIVAVLTPRRRFLDVGAVLFVTAAWLGIRGAWGPFLADADIAIALGVMAAGGALVHQVARRIRGARDHPVLVAAIAMTPGAALLAVATPLAGSTLTRTCMALAAVVLGIGIRDFDAMRGAPGAPWLLFAVTAVGVYLAVPDTELARVMLGVALPFALLSLPTPLLPVGPAGSAALAGLFAWVVFVGGRGRPGSVVGGLATIGLLLAEPLGRRCAGVIMTTASLARVRRARRPGDEYLLVAGVAAAAQFAFVLYASRVVAAADDAVRAVAILIPVAAIAVFCSPILYREPPPRDVPRGTRSTARHHSSHRSHRSHSSRTRRS